MSDFIDALIADPEVRAVGALDTLPTPLLLIDAEIMQNNLTAMANYCSSHQLWLRPHVKTHKSICLARLQLRLGAIGLTAAKPTEAAEVVPAATDLVIAYPSFTTARVQTLAKLTGRGRVRIAIDSSEAVRRISATVGMLGIELGMLIDLDVGHHRTGLSSVEEVLAVADEIERSGGLRLDGVLFFPGHLLPTTGSIAAGQQQISRQLSEIISALTGAGHRISIVSGGSTPTAKFSHLVPELTEIRPGTYIFNDLNSIRWGCATVDQCAAVVLATVVSTAVKGKAVIDAGSKMLSSDRCGATPDSGFGLLVDQPAAKLSRLSEEHGEIDLGASGWQPRVGDVVKIIPNHICPVVNLQNEVVLLVAPDQCFQMAVNGRGRVH